MKMPVGKMRVGNFSPCFCMPKKTHGLSQKIQGTYFKISALYFKIYALYFSPFGMLETQRLTKPEKQAFAGIGKRIRKRANGNALRP